MRKLLLLLLLLCACKKEERELVRIEKVEVTESVRLGDTVYLYLEGHLPDPCWEFQGYDITQSDTVIQIWPWMVRKEEEACVCLQYLVAFTDTLAFLFHSPGTYRFYVYTSDTFLTATSEVWIK